MILTIKVSYVIQQRSARRKQTVELLATVETQKCFCQYFYSLSILVNFALYCTTEIVIPAPEGQF